MPRYIDANKAIDEINRWIDTVGTATIGKGLSYYAELLGCIEDVETVDVNKAIEKQIPKKVIFDWDACLCPNCKFDMMGVWDYPDVEDPKYCPMCGQALKWGEK